VFSHNEQAEKESRWPITPDCQNKYAHTFKCNE